MIHGCEDQKQGSAEAESWRLPKSQPSFPNPHPTKLSRVPPLPWHTRGHGACPQHGPVSSRVNTELRCCSCNFPNQPWVSSHKLSRVDQLLLATERGSISKSGAGCGAGGLALRGGGMQG